MSRPGWIIIRLASGAWRCQHVATGSAIFIARTATEATVLHRLAEVTATITRLSRRGIA